MGRAPIRKGPNLKATFHLEDKGIAFVTLSKLPKSEMGMQWEVAGKSRITGIKSMIDRWMGAFCKGEQPKVELPIILEGLPPFTKRILTILMGIPFGVQVTYKELAELAGSPKGARAVGNACSRNPCLLIVPCHRVLSENGLGGFSAGLPLKKILLSYEDELT